MVVGLVESRVQAGAYPELAGARVLITGLEAGHGVEIARAFADAGAKLILQAPAMSPELEVVLEILAASAEEIEVSGEPIPDEAAALRFAQNAAKTFGGLDIVINLARLDDKGLAADADLDEVEDRVAATLGRPFRITHVIANRMQLTWKEGLILNIVTQGPPQTLAAAHLGRIARAALGGLTRQEARRWADKAVRINAIVPADEESCEPGGISTGLASEPEVAALALHLAGRRGSSMSGLVFDAALAGAV